MKKTLVCTAVLAAMLSLTATSYAATYESGDANKVTTTAADGQKAVIIIKGDASTVPTDENIVYVNQANSTFSGTTDFLIKASPTEGEYTVMYGGGNGGKTTETFYIGVGAFSGDAAMDKIEGEVGYTMVGENNYNIGYTATVDLSSCKSIIIKKSDGTYMGCEIPTGLEGGGSAKIGIQINGASSLTEISGVWLSSRVFDKNTGTASAE